MAAPRLVRVRSTWSRGLTRLAVLACLGGSACQRVASTPPATAFAVNHGTTARYAAVHVDHLQDGALQAFVRARRTWLAALAAHEATDGRGLFLQTGDSGFLSLRPLNALGDLDRAPALTKAALASVDPKDLRAYDAASDALLAPPHRSEIWRFDEDASFGVTDPMQALTRAAWGKMTVEELDPTPAGDAYDAAWKEIRAALTAANYPIVRVSYWSTYGSGNLVSIWLSRSQDEFLNTPSVEATVAATLGASESERLFERLRRVVRASDSVDVIPRLDLSSRAL